MSDAILTRYASPEMKEIFSDRRKFELWRQLWVNLAEAEQDVGVDISYEQIWCMKEHMLNINIERAEEIEKETQHDVMAHIKAYGEQCPEAAGIIHLGATSCYVTDNADVLRMRDGLNLVRKKIVRIIDAFRPLAEAYKDTVCLSYTHFQVAQPTTVGKRIAMWMQDLVMDYRKVSYAYHCLHLLGCRGATGTADSLMALVDDDPEKAREIEDRICLEYNMLPFPVSGQTYTRKQDFDVLQTLSGVAQSASKFANDLRLLAHEGEMMEGFGENQVGSSAMPYKQNPMKCERINSLARHVICNLQNVSMTAATQWLERTLDDSANRRIVIPEMFLVTDAILDTYYQVVDTLVIRKSKIHDNIFPYHIKLRAERLMMYCVGKKGLDRQKTHECLRQAMAGSSEAEFWDKVMWDGYVAENLSTKEINDILCGPITCGMAVQQVDNFLCSIENFGHGEQG